MHCDRSMLFCKTPVDAVDELKQQMSFMLFLKTATNSLDCWRMSARR